MATLFTVIVLSDLVVEWCGKVSYHGRRNKTVLLRNVQAKIKEIKEKLKKGLLTDLIKIVADDKWERCAKINSEREGGCSPLPSFAS